MYIHFRQNNKVLNIKHIRIDAFYGWFNMHDKEKSDSSDKHWACLFSHFSMNKPNPKNVFVHNPTGFLRPYTVQSDSCRWIVFSPKITVSQHTLSVFFLLKQSFCQMTLLLPRLNAGRSYAFFWTRAVALPPPHLP